jgi:hypothetical protein
VWRSSLGISQAFSSRYQTVSLVFWCCLGLLLVGAAAAPQRMRNNGFVLVQLTLLVIMLVGARYAKTPFIRARVRGIKLNTAAMSLVTNVPDIEQFRWAFWQPNSLPSFVPYMRRERLSVFDDPNSWLLSRPLESAFNLAPANECAGELETSVVMRSVAAGPAALRITGWAWDYKRREPPSAIVVATDGIITGLGAMGDYRPVNKTVRPWITTNYIGYTAYIQEARTSGPVQVYAILRGSPARACLIATCKVRRHRSNGGTRLMDTRRKQARNLIRVILRYILDTLNKYQLRWSDFGARHGGRLACHERGRHVLARYEFH